MRAQADAAARESRERFQASIETLSDPFVSVGPLRDQAGRILDFVYEYANGAACLTNILAREDPVGMSVLDRVSRSNTCQARSIICCSRVRRGDSTCDDGFEGSQSQVPTRP
jgi:hypothetical protein